MYLDFAPMEGITTALYRRLHKEYFGGIDRYYSPFLSPTQDHRFTPREQREIYPQYNDGIILIPQLLTKNAEDFLWAASELSSMGYRELNLNLGCPSGTVTAKGKGCGMLADPDYLDRFLDTIFSKTPCSISIKTRLGIDNCDEFHRILSIYNRYPMTELIIHPRIRKDFYRHPVRIKAFEAALATSCNPVSYNGSIVTKQDYQSCQQRYPDLASIMIGQGMVSDPFLAARIRFGAVSNKELLRAFSDAVLEGYAEQFGNRMNAMKRMKDIWFYQIKLFHGSEKYGKRIMKAQSVEDYQNAVSSVFNDLDLLEASTGGW